MAQHTRKTAPGRLGMLALAAVSLMAVAVGCGPEDLEITNGPCQVWLCGDERPEQPCSDLCEQPSDPQPTVYARDPETSECWAIDDADMVPEGWAVFGDEDACLQDQEICRRDQDCDEGLICNLTSCEPGGAGTCVPRPESCPDGGLPVYDCEGYEYANDCERLLYGARLAADTDTASGGCSETSVWIWDPEQGRCVEVVSDCEVPPGTEFFSDETLCSDVVQRCGPDLACAEGTVCEPWSCGEADGRCVPLPAECMNATEDALGAVCGCDGVTYPSDCLRLMSGVGLASPGPCGGAGAEPW